VTRRATRTLLRLGDLIAGAWLLGSALASERSRPEPFLARPFEEAVYAGTVLRELAMAEEMFYAAHQHYARRAADLDVDLPAAWRVTVLAAPARQYRLQLDAPTEQPFGVVCLLWGNRTRNGGLEPFNIDCQGADESAERAMGGGAASDGSSERWVILWRDTSFVDERKPSKTRLDSVGGERAPSRSAR
jgi:hypothetical protein